MVDWALDIIYTTWQQCINEISATYWIACRNGVGCIWREFISHDLLDGTWNSKLERCLPSNRALNIDRVCISPVPTRTSSRGGTMKSNLINLQSAYWAIICWKSWIAGIWRRMLRFGTQWTILNNCTKSEDLEWKPKMIQSGRSEFCPENA